MNISLHLLFMPCTNKSHHFLSPGKSNFLNFVHWAAALLVVLGHSDMYLKKFGGDLVYRV